MGIFGKRIVKKDGSETDTHAQTRLEILNEIEDELVESGNEAVKDITNFLAVEDGFDMDNVRYLPYIKKYLAKINNLMRMSFKASRIEIERMEKLEKRVEKMTESFESIDKNLNRIANAMENQNYVEKALKKEK